MVDDEEVNLRLVQRILTSAGYHRVEAFRDPAAALRAVEEEPADLLILDLHMPAMDGLELMSRVRRVTDTRVPVPVVVLTSDGSRETKERALRGGARDYLVKPFSPLELRLRIGNLLEALHLDRALAARNRHLDTMLAERTAELERARIETLEKLARAAEYRDDETGEHIRRVGHLSAWLGRTMGLDREMVEVLRRAAPLHDVGKIGIDDSILRKPGKLTPREFEIMKTHTTIGASILAGSPSPVLRGGERIARSHHENWDGSGYPRGLSGREIPLEARIVAVADVFDSLTHERVYKEASSPEEAEATICDLEGTKFDPDVVDAFRAIREAGGP